jgi:hypothetical protein
LFRITTEDKMALKEKRESEDKKEWAAPTLTILNVETVTRSSNNNFGPGEGNGYS